MTKYFITLEPTTPFFFGSENTFGDDNQNYYAKSNYLPQQTSILGMLRYQLLLQNDLIGTNPKEKEWAKLIGSSSFKEVNDQYVDKFGAIKNISPIFLTNGKKHFIPQSLDWAEYAENVNDKTHQYIGPIRIEKEEGNIHLSRNIDCIPLAKVNGKIFDPKYGLKSMWVSNDGKSMHDWDFNRKYVSSKYTIASNQSTVQLQNGFFIKHEQVGIHKVVKKYGHAEEKNKKAFYRQIFYRLVSGLKFAFFLESDEKPDSGYVKMGGENSTFFMDVKEVGKDEIPTSFKDTFSSSTFHFSDVREGAYIILTSDSLLKEEDYNKCDFSICETTPFRHITTSPSKSMNRHGDLSRNSASAKSGRSKTELKYLLKRGSILYGDESSISHIGIMLKANAGMRNIGYNHFETNINIQ